MPEFEVEVQSILHEYYIVEADSKDEAKERVLSGEVDTVCDLLYGEPVDFHINEVNS